ncbi:hypothetical protein Pyn_38573 [Prunus yedoensis var. nudiflora]|uniref:Uncharacterized protein n=1 Tax=Prunus yedoensis var. nudiflora TaxID=2094558 RepID=A0A314UYR5_PRUYE|nr:hypothetical protein Pyn_38573 [Prunus yedoensis var. nudiflora]
MATVIPVDEIYASIVHRTRRSSLAQRLRGWKIECRQLVKEEELPLMCHQCQRNDNSRARFERWNKKSPHVDEVWRDKEIRMLFGLAYVENELLDAFLDAFCHPFGHVKFENLGIQVHYPRD